MISSLSWSRVGVLLWAVLLLSACAITAEAPETRDKPAARATGSVPVNTTVTAASTPEPVLLPAPKLFARALHRRHIGDEEGAALDFQTVLEQYPDAPEARPAHFYLAESFARRGRWTSAVAAFQAFLEEPQQDDYTPLALFWLARSYEEVGNWSAAAETYQRYRALDTPVEPYAAARQAALQRELGQIAEAAQSFEHAATSGMQPGEQAGSYEKAIALRLQMGQEQDALHLYEELLQLASLPAYRARILSEAAALAEKLGQTDTARAWLREVVTLAPDTSYAVNAVRQLTEAGDPALNPADAALALFASGNYQEALPMFESAIQQAPAGSEEALDLRRQRALTQRALGDFPAALDKLAAVADAAPPGSAPDLQARLDWIQTLGQSGEVEQAAERYYEYAHLYQQDWRAPVALDRAAQLYARLGNAEQAAQLRVELGARYPQSDLTPAALNMAAWHFFGSGRLDESRNAWEMLASNSQGYECARGAFWAARVARSQQDTEQAADLFETARTAAPDSYYGVRAAEELGVTLTGSALPGASITEEEWQDLAAWVQGWQDPAVVQASGPVTLTDVANSGFVQRAVALRQVGLNVEAIGEWNSARDAWAEDPSRLMFLARLAHEHNMPYIGLKTGEQLAALAPDNAPPKPRALERLIFPTPYAEVFIAEASAQNIDPRLFYALVRQESLFNPGATSWVGARGLAQVMPATGEGIASDLGVAGFQLDDLYRPQVSIRFGAYYIGRRLADMNGNVQGALAAYNGGLGNAIRWADGYTVENPDLFTESIDYPETQGYVKRVYGFYGSYRRLYALPNG